MSFDLVLQSVSVSGPVPVQPLNQQRHEHLSWFCGCV